MNTNNQELGVSVLKATFSMIPIYGGVLNEVFFDFWGRIKQNRLNAFTEMLAEALQNQAEIPIENFKTEDFTDLMVSVVKRVVETKSIPKQLRFKDILMNQLNNPSYSIDHAETFLDLISELADVEIAILKDHQLFDYAHTENEKLLRAEVKRVYEWKDELKKQQEIAGRRHSNNVGTCEQEILKSEHRITELQGKVRINLHARHSKFYDINEDDFTYYKQHLFSKGLMRDAGLVRTDYQPFAHMGITEFGKKFIAYVIKDDNSVSE